MIRITTPDQVEANRLNALHSTGPSSERGKAVSSLNAMTYGLSGSGLHLPDREAAKAIEVQNGLVASLKPTDAAEALLVKQMAVYTVKADQARALQIERRTELAQRAEAAWVCDRQAGVAELAGKLGEDPERIVPMLLGSLQGAEWLAGRWGALKRKLDLGGTWDEADRKLVLDLLGFSLDYRDRILPSESEIDDAGELRRTHLALAEREAGNLRALIATSLRDLDEADLDRARRGVESHKDRDTKLFRRYEREAQRRFEWAWNELKRMRRERNEPERPTADFMEAAPPEFEFEPVDAETVQDEVVDELLSEFEEVAAGVGSTEFPAKGNRRQRRRAEAAIRKARHREKFGRGRS